MGLDLPTLVSADAGYSESEAVSHGDDAPGDCNASPLDSPDKSSRGDLQLTCTHDGSTSGDSSPGRSNKAVAGLGECPPQICHYGFNPTDDALNCLFLALSMQGHVCAQRVLLDVFGSHT